MKKNSTNLIFCASVFILTASLAGVGYFYKTTESSINSLNSIRNGSHICASRVSQSFISFAGSALSALSLEKRFLNATEDCFSGVDEKASSLSSYSFEGLSAAMLGEYLRFKNLVRNTDTQVSSVQKSFYKINDAKFNLGVKLNKVIRTLESRRQFLKYGFIGILGLLTLLAVMFLIVWKTVSSKIGSIEEEAKFIVDDFENNGPRLERLIERTLDFVNVPVLKNVFLDYHTYVTETRSLEALKEPNYKKVGFGATSSLEDEYVVQVFSEEEANAIAMEQQMANSGDGVVLDNLKTTSSLNEVSNLLDDENLSTEEINKLSQESNLQEEKFETTEMNDLNDLEMTLKDNPVDFDAEEYVEVLGENDESLEAVTLADIAKKAEELDAADSVKTSDNSNDAETWKVEEVAASTQMKEEVKTVSEFKKILAKVTRAFLRNTTDSALTWEFDSSYIDFNMMKNSEELVHILHALVTRYHKGFCDSDTNPVNRIIKVSRDILDGDVVIEFKGKNLVFNTAELEYFNTSDPSLKKLVDVNFIMLHKLSLDIKGDIEVRNEFSDSGEREAIVKIYLPLITTSISPGSQLEIKKAESGKFFSRVLKGTKKQLNKRLKKETTV